MQQDWAIQSRAEQCSVTGARFQDGEYFYTVLYEEGAGFRREDLSEAAWQERQSQTSGSPQPFSFWRSKFESPPAVAPEPLAKQTAEDLLRRYTADQAAEFSNVRYILAVMLERKRLLKHIDTRETEQGETALIYEHVKTGEVFVVADPHLHLDQITSVQKQVADLLGGSAAA